MGGFLRILSFSILGSRIPIRKLTAFPDISLWLLKSDWISILLCKPHQQQPSLSQRIYAGKLIRLPFSQNCSEFHSADSNGILKLVLVNSLDFDIHKYLFQLMVLTNRISKPNIFKLVVQSCWHHFPDNSRSMPNIRSCNVWGLFSQHKFIVKYFRKT